MQTFDFDENGCVPKKEQANVGAEGASPETLVSLLEELQRNPQLKQLVAAG